MSRTRKFKVPAGEIGFQLLELQEMGSLAFTSPTAQETGGGQFRPPLPKTLEELGINQNILVDLMLKMTLLEGQTNLNHLSATMKISIELCTAIFTHLRKEKYLEVKGMAGNDYEFALSQAGRKLAQDRYQISNYIGPAPVSLTAYTQAVRRQAKRQNVSREKL